MASNYNDMKILKTTRQEIKLSMFYLKDLAIVLVCGVAVYFLNDLLQLPLIYFVLLEIIAIAFAIFLCIRPANSGNVRNITVMKRLFVMDREIYHNQNFK